MKHTKTTFLKVIKCSFPRCTGSRGKPRHWLYAGRITLVTGKSLRKIGCRSGNKEMSGQCIQDRKLITGDSPLASNTLGKIAAQALLAEVQ